VRIRNLSESGGMLEGAAFPNIGEKLVLRRAELDIGATVMWLMGTRCGVKFDGTISVSEWVSGKAAPRGQVRDQAHVDAIQAAVRAGVDLPPAEHPAATGGVSADLDLRIAEELAYVRRLLEGVGDNLTDDPMIAQRHAKQLQEFDLACQILGYLGGILFAEDRAAAVDAIGLQDLRARLTRNPLFRE
jgi:hypothetical protein